jgi:hypothetical protein
MENDLHGTKEVQIEFRTLCGKEIVPLVHEKYGETYHVVSFR